MLLFIWSLINVLLVLLAAASSHYRFLVTKYTLSSRTLDDRTLSNVLEGTTFSDWVLLTRFTDNLHRSAYINVFRALLRELPGQQHVQELRSLDLTRKNNQFSNHHNHSGSPNGGPRQSQTEVFFAHL